MAAASDAPKKPRLVLLRTLWGCLSDVPVEEGGGERQLENALKAFAAAGYDGIECPLSWAYKAGRERFIAAIRSTGLMFVPLFFTSGPVPNFYGASHHPAAGPTVAEHVAVFKAQCEDAFSGEWPNVFFANSHTGADWFTAAQADEMFIEILAFCAERKYEVYHETHRGRVLYSPWVARDICRRHPTLRLTFDLSHWTCVAEVGPDSDSLNEVVAELTPRCGHIHARVGFAQGPQVPDPRAPEWAATTKGFGKWWRAVYESAAARGAERISVLAEHGPPPYQHTLPFTRNPTADVWDVNHWIAHYAKAIYTETGGLPHRLSAEFSCGYSDSTHVPRTGQVPPPTCALGNIG